MTQLCNSYMTQLSNYYVTQLSNESMTQLCHTICTANIGHSAQNNNPLPKLLLQQGLYYRMMREAKAQDDLPMPCK